MTQILTTTLNALRYVKNFSGQRILIKLGGSILDDESLVPALCEDLSLLRAAGIQLIIVHGGGKAINAILEAHGVSWTFHQGQRVTTAEMMTFIEMALCGGINQMLVRRLNAYGVAAVGVSGADQSLLYSERFDADLGEVGRIKKLNLAVIEPFFQQQSLSREAPIPVIAPVGVDDAGLALNINADWAATAIAQALNIHKLIYLTDQDGIYDDRGQMLSELDTAQLFDLVQSGVVKGGMLTKVNTILDALNQGIDNIHILNARQPHVLIQELFTAQGVGTLCKKRV